MSDVKHTPGPWKYRKGIFASSGYYIETVDQSHHKTFIGDVGGGLHSSDELEANAKLIAAAPDLLAFAKHVVNVFPFGSTLSDMAIDVIQKATE